MKRKKCYFSKMGSRIIPRYKNKKKTEEILKDRDKRKREFNKWLRG